MEWISVEERKPPNDHYVLVAKYYKHKKHPIGSMYFIQISSRMNDAWIDDHNGEIIKPTEGIITHWMPLPDVPEIKDGMD